MNPLQRMAFLVLILLFSIFLAQWWLSTGMSESIWTWINVRIEDGQNPGLASDIELLATLAGALCISATGAMLIRRLCVRICNKADDSIR